MHSNPQEKCRDLETSIPVLLNIVSKNIAVDVLVWLVALYWYNKNGMDKEMECFICKHVLKQYSESNLSYFLDFSIFFILSFSV